MRGTGSRVSSGCRQYEPPRGDYRGLGGILDIAHPLLFESRSERAADQFVGPGGNGVVVNLFKGGLAAVPATTGRGAKQGSYKRVDAPYGDVGGRGAGR